jgi:GH35 family endo-1,4-beta-xylanase
MRLLSVLLIFLTYTLSAQDDYTTNLLTDLKDQYGLEGGSFLLPNTEELVSESIITYGNIMVRDAAPGNQAFSRSKEISVATAGNNPWDSGMFAGSSNSVTSGDLIFVTFWARHKSSSSQVFVFAEDAISFDKEYYFPISFTPDWTQYFVAFNSNKSYNVDRLRFGFQLSSQAQEVEIAGLLALNYKDNFDLSDLPSSFSPFDYEGRDLDAPWRALADARIEQIRKSNLEISVLDKNGNPVNDASVRVEMQKHDFGFGSALVTCRFPGNNCFDQTYVDKVLDLDGEGHGFNVGVNENALKWRAWEQEWLGTPEEMVAAFKWLDEQGVTMRGHNLIWPGSDFLPTDINENLNDIDYLRNRIDARIEEMINHPELSTIVRDWDVLNEITTNRTLESAFNNDPTLGNGRELYSEIFNKVRDLDPTLELYINDYMAISLGSSNLVARYKMFLDELRDADVPFDGIGFQGHIGSVPNSIPQVEQIFNDFYQRYGKRMKITEYDINPAVDEAIQADYMRDFLTITFSHPGMDAFILWGFWDGNHWKDNAPIFYQDWTLKPSGESFIQKVFNDWWTDETDSTDANGQVTFRPFKGQHIITVTKDGETVETEVELLEDGEIEIILSDISNTIEVGGDQFVLSPNPTDEGSFSIDFPSGYSDLTVELYDINSRLIGTYNSVTQGKSIGHDLDSGLYLVKLITDDADFVKRLVVK